MDNLRSYFSQADIDQASPEQLYRMRVALAARDPAAASAFAPIEHQGAMRSGVGIGGVPAAIGLGALTAGYTPAKFAAQNPQLMMAMPGGQAMTQFAQWLLSKADEQGGNAGAQSPASFEELARGFRGIGQGLRDYFTGNKPQDNAGVERQIQQLQNPEQVISPAGQETIRRLNLQPGPEFNPATWETAPDIMRRKMGY